MTALPFQPRRLALLLLSSCPALLATVPARAAEGPAALPEVEIKATRLRPLAEGAGPTPARLAGLKATTSDTAALLQDVPGVALAGAGGLSSLPVVRGLPDDRNRVQVDGMDLISACGNHMNPPLSYLESFRVGAIQVYTGAVPVSLGGDSIGATVVAESAPPPFAAPGEGTVAGGALGAFYRSNGAARGVQGEAHWASERLSVRYAGGVSTSDNLRAAKDFKPATQATWTRSGTHPLDANEIGSTAYTLRSHSLGFALRSGEHMADLKVNVQEIPRQGFPNQHMDMTDNHSIQVNLGYTGSFAWGSLQARLYNEETRHRMDFGDDKLYWYGSARNVAGMPMETHGVNTGARVRADVNLNERDILRVGSEYQRYHLNDWWPPVANAMMMSPNTFQNLHNGQRDRMDVFAEWEAAWSPRWQTLAGLRSSTVRMDADPVQGYNTMAMMYGADAARFNAASRARTDHNLDATLLARFTPDAGRSFDAGYARKTRSPSLYERYTWSTNGMAMTMNNWVNDGNGYVGSIDLAPEVAHTLSASADLHDAGQARWGVKLQSFYTYVNNYINARCLTSCPPNQFNYLRLVNTDARLYGADLSGYRVLDGGETLGPITGRGTLAYVHGKDTHSDDGLYNQMPLNARLSLEQKHGPWTTAVEEVLVGAKRAVSQVRNEIATGGYALLNLRSSYDTRHYRVDLGLENALNRFYASPLGGAYIGQGTTMSLNGAGAPYGIAVPSMGRSVYVALTVRY